MQVGTVAAPKRTVTLAEASVVHTYYHPGRRASRHSGTSPLVKRREACHTICIPKETHMETLDLATLALLDALESDLEVPDFDADELLDDEA